MTVTNYNEKQAFSSYLFHTHKVIFKLTKTYTFRDILIVTSTSKIQRINI